MADTLCSSTSANSSLPLGLSVPHPSQDISSHQIPDVFVIPPEEEQDINPPFQYFDASMAQAEIAATSPDIDALDVALSLFQQADGNRAPIFHRHHANESHDTIIMPKRSLSRQSMIADREDVPDDIMESRSSHRRGFDEDVVEIVKVRRNEGMTDVTNGKHSMRKSKTFRARASQALRSIKNVGKTGRKPLSGVWPSVERDENAEQNQYDSSDIPTTPNLSRRKSATLSQLFGTVRTNSRSPMTQSVVPSFASESPLPTPQHPSTSLGDRTNIPMAIEHEEENHHIKPSLSKRKSFRNRISVLDLQRLFTPSTQATADANASPAEEGHTRPSSRASKRESIPFSLSSRFTAKHHTPVAAEDVFSSSWSQPSFETQRSSLALSKSSSNNSSTLRREFDEDVILESSFEMRLDSLHFDSLHFDPEEYEL